MISLKCCKNPSVFAVVEFVTFFCMIGMKIVGLKTFIEKHQQSVQLIFLSQNDAPSNVNEVK